MATQRSTSKKGGGKEQTETFEESVRRLEDIAEKLEDGSVSIDDALTIYEEGIQLSKQCLEKLAQVELKLKRLSKDVQGNFDLYAEEEGE